MKPIMCAHDSKCLAIYCPTCEPAYRIAQTEAKASTDVAVRAMANVVEDMEDRFGDLYEQCAPLRECLDNDRLRDDGPVETPLAAWSMFVVALYRSALVIEFDRALKVLA